MGKGTVCQLVTKAKKNKKFLSELLSLEDAASAYRQKITEVVEGLNQQHAFIDSASSVQKILLEEHQVKSKGWEVLDVMRQELDMRFKKVKPVSIHANSKKNLVLRQQFALRYIRLL